MSELLLACTIAGRAAALPAARVVTVIDLGTVTSVPRAPRHILGITALRSQALTVFDCRVAFGLEPLDSVAGKRAAVVNVEGQPYALVLDDVSDVTPALGDPAAVPGGFGSGWQACAVGLVETAAGPHLLLDIERLVATPLEDAA